MEQKLCKKCKGYLIGSSERWLIEIIHCHHDDPEKPGYVWKPTKKKKKRDECWCDNPADDVEDSKGCSWVTDWCPTCGRKLEEDE